jgi:hypothetical protein
MVSVALQRATAGQGRPGSSGDARKWRARHPCAESVRLTSPAKCHQRSVRRTRSLGLLLVLALASCGCGAAPTSSRALPPLPNQGIRAISTTGDVIVSTSPKESRSTRAAKATLPAAERSALAQLPHGSRVVSGSLFLLADAPGPGEPTQVLAWVLQTVPKGGYPAPSCGPVLAGHRPHCPTYNLRIDFVNALTGKWIMATETSTALGRTSNSGSVRQGVVVGGIWPCEGSSHIPRASLGARLRPCGGQYISSRTRTAHPQCSPDRW